MTLTQNAMGAIPTGLEYLSQIDQLLIHQQVEILEGISYINSFESIL